jgi:hypothetical protein
MEQLLSTAPLKTKSATILAKQKDQTLAAYYTPRDVAQILTDWALTDPRDTVLDPSYGGCSFLTSAQTTLLKLGNPQPEKQIFGIDIDPDAQNYLNDLLASGAKRQQFINEDFFKIDVNRFDDRLFSAVVGNPPYLRYHSIPDVLQKQADNRLKEYGIAVSGRASYWAYFLLYSIKFLRRGGRLAMVLPGALLHTDYAINVKEYLTKNFEHVSIYLLEERIFDGTQEESVIVCAEGAGIPNRTVRIGYTTSVSELASAIEGGSIQTRILNSENGDGGWLRNLLDEESSCLYDELVGGKDVIRLGDWVGTRIGVVTGNNSYFIMSDQAREERGIPTQYFLHVIKRPAYISGLMATNHDLKTIRQQNKDYLLLYPPTSLSKMPKSLLKYIEEGEEMGISSARKCRSRNPWYVVPHVSAPEAFMPCMSASWPRLIVNQSDYTCTNNILKLSWKDIRPASDWSRLALGTLSTLSQLSSELVGRSYGGGVLKLEPRELARLAVPLVPTEISHSLAKRVDDLIRKNNLNKATEAVDEVLMRSNPMLSTKKLEQLRTARKKLFLRRRQHRRDASKIIQ